VQIFIFSSYLGITSDNAEMARIGLKDLRLKLTEVYPFGGPKRFQIPDNKTSWEESWSAYQPPYFTAKRVLENPDWADKELGDTNLNDIPKWNSIDGKISRVSYMGTYKLDEEGYPLNPVGRTGIRGRGVLGKWGPNHAADPIVTRWKRDSTGELQSPKILQFIGIQRRDTGEWAIPGGMIDAGEDSGSALKREFFEEVFSIEDSSKEDAKLLESSLAQLFANGTDIYKGYVDDPRNTDNAWMETHAVNFHAEGKTEEILNKIALKAGSDAKNAAWIDISSKLALYASHVHFIKSVAELKDALW